MMCMYFSFHSFCKLKYSWQKKNFFNVNVNYFAAYEQSRILPQGIV